MDKIIMKIQNLARMVDTVVEDNLNVKEISRGQYPYIDYLYNHEGANQYDISRDLFIDKTTVAKALKKLESTNMIYRRTDSKDKRKVNVHLTASGKEVYKDVEKSFEFVKDIMNTNIDPSLSDKLESLVELFIQELDIVWCDIKNYKRKNKYDVATESDIAQLEERNIFKLNDKDTLFVEKFGNHITNWISFRVDEKYNVIANNIHFHQMSDEIIDGMDLVREFEEWYKLNYSNKIYFVIDDYKTGIQKLLHKNSYLFKKYEKNMVGIKYIYEKKW